VYFVDSYANFNDPSVAKTVVTLLEHLDYQVIVPPQKESGMPAIEYGLLNRARSLARFNINELAPYARVGRPVVCSSPAATYLLREGYRKILDEPEVATVSEAIVDMSELLLKEYESGNLHFIDGTQRNVIYHNCCLSKALSLGSTTTKLLDAASIPWTQVDDCCGGAGVWGTFKENYEISSEIAGKLESKLEPTLTVLTDSETCRLQLEAHTNATVRFPLELLAPNVKGLKR
jgi:glycerol-3-phosphate dehydrogenase subunit C